MKIQEINKILIENYNVRVIRFARHKNNFQFFIEGGDPIEFKYNNSPRLKNKDCWAILLKHILVNSINPESKKIYFKDVLFINIKNINYIDINAKVNLKFVKYDKNEDEYFEYDSYYNCSIHEAVERFREFEFFELDVNNNYNTSKKALLQYTLIVPEDYAL